MHNKSNRASEIQKQFWLLDHQGKAAAYPVVSAFRFTGLELQRFCDAVQLVVSRFAVLNGVFTMDGTGLSWQVGDAPVQRIDRQVATEREARAFIGRESFQPFDLASGPVLRLLVAEVENSNICHVALAVHHIVLDLRTKQLLAGLISNVYNQGPQALDDTDLGDNYAEFAQWQAEWMRSPEAERSRTFWKTKLDRVNRQLVMPEQGSVGDYFEVPFSLGAETYTQLLDYCRRNRTDEFIVLFAAYYYLLGYFSGMADFAVGVPLSNRRQEAFKSSVGCFVNMLPLRLNLNDCQQFSDVIQCARKGLLEAHRHQELPTAEIVRSLSDEAHKRQLYNLGFTFEDHMQLSLDGVTSESLETPGVASQLDGFLRLWHADGSLGGRLECDGALWSETLASRFIKTLEQLVTVLISSESDRLSQLDFLTADDHQQLQLNNDTDYEFPLTDWRNQTLVSLFEQQVAATGDGIAVIAGNREYSYREFDALSNQFAHWLAGQGVCRGDVVAVYCQRSVEMLVAIYGVIKLGAAYLPVDIELPGERVEQMLSTAAAKRIVVGPLQTLPEGVTTPAVSCDLAALAELPSKPQGAVVNSEDPAYVIFTSGSTGVPKGVVNGHLGIVNRLLWMQETFNLSAGERVLQKTPYSFDVSVWELFWPLQVGATLVLAEHNSHRDPYRLAEQIAEHGIHLLHFVPSMLAAYLDAERDLPASMRAVVCSGEELPQALQFRFFARYSQVTLANLYGPTEAAVDVSYWLCDTEMRKQVPIGVPVSNTSLYVVDKEGRQTPVGVVGELLIGGIQVAQGYINAGELTASRFIDNPFGDGRVYRTGDNARWTEDGYLEYMGRRDFQVKINGVRIELGEIENVIAQVPEVSTVVVTVHKTGEAQRLLAYYALKPGRELDVKAIQKAATRRLPAYMVPSRFIVVDEMPVGVNGKVDRKALPVPDNLTLVASAQRRDTDMTTTQRKIWQLWSATLGLVSFGMDDSFFDLGGDSLLLMGTFKHLREEFPLLRSVDMFRYTTIRSLARFLDAGAGPDKNDDEPAEAGPSRAARMQQAMRGGPRLPRKKMR